MRPRRAVRFARLIDRRVRAVGRTSVRAACGGNLMPALIATQGGTDERRDAFQRGRSGPGQACWWHVHSLASLVPWRHPYRRCTVSHSVPASGVRVALSARLVAPQGTPHTHWYRS